MHSMRRWIDDYVVGELPAKRAERFESHVARCADCRVQLDDRRRRVRRNARYTSSLPVVVNDGAVSHSSYVVAVGAQRGSTYPAGQLGLDDSGSRRHLLPLAGLVGVFALLIALVCTAWYAGGTTTTSRAASAVTAQWDEDGRKLSAQDVTDLRRAGWNLPGLAALGYTMKDAVGAVIDGLPRVTVSYNGPAGTILVSEARKTQETLAASALLGAGVDLGTGSEETNDAAEAEEGIALAPVGIMAAGVESDVETSRIDTQNAAYALTYPSDDGGQEAVINRIVLTENSQLKHASGTEDSLLSRIGRGLGRMGLLEVSE
ncbi:zf-HC2 domain-containing protein [Zhihengliuella flava]|uniref:Anti-sigma factor RsiW n=1 Tax=Zhihengliuella flava TaxID=1285193 RepID=A0A931GML9_9MICC|nr:zf-HC2 domain-containing protein [Zhihengliuella flava]MBG6085549.1 anti-sigma factor RsiW [Zhihengliuella flava]